MNRIDQMIIDNLQYQINKTIKSLELKKTSSKESVIDIYIKNYKDASDFITTRSLNSDDDNLKKLLKKLLNCSRGYLETSSDYTQDFLKEMNETEKLIKSI